MAAKVPTKRLTKVKYKKKKAEPKLSSDRFDYKVNHQLIENEMFKHICETMVMPTMMQLSERTGLNYKTIQRHSKDIRIRNFMTEYKCLTPRVMRGLLIKASSGKNGSTEAAKLWLQVVENFAERIETDHKVEVKPLEETLDDKTKQKMYALAAQELKKD